MNIIHRLKGGGRKPKRLYMRATAVVVNENREVLLVKHNGQKEWSLPGGHIMPGEDPAHRARPGGCGGNRTTDRTAQTHGPLRRHRRRP